MELYRYKGRWQLATIDALYSDGDKYSPLVRAYKEVKTKLSGIKDALVLGTGLGSAVQIFHSMGFSAKFTLVEYDAEILKWAMELMPPILLHDINPVCADAKNYITTDSNQYDMLVVDIFEGRIVPVFVTKLAFLQECRKRLRTGGIFIMNYIAIKEDEWEAVRLTINKAFPENKVIRQGLNRIVIATA
ncbi:MAG: spermidine synthase [Flavipsychrobacter sp.]